MSPWLLRYQKTRPHPSVLWGCCALSTAQREKRLCRLCARCVANASSHPTVSAVSLDTLYPGHSSRPKNNPDGYTCTANTKFRSTRLEHNHARLLPTTRNESCRETERWVICGAILEAQKYGISRHQHLCLYVSMLPTQSLQQEHDTDCSKCSRMTFSGKGREESPTRTAIASQVCWGERAVCTS